ncbi:MAG: hypothetical protein AB3N16_09350, partial [Flavobacteriaceae bacterium]
IFIGVQQTQMIKKIAASLLFLAFLGLRAQEGTASPYSYFGIGELSSGASVENQMMGSIGVLADSIHLSFQNPAAYSQLLDMGDNGKMVTYTAGISHKQLRLNSFTEQESTSLTNIDYLALGFGLAKGWGIGFGVKPYSSVGHSIVSEKLNAAQDTVTNQYSGDGGLNKVFISSGGELLKGLSVGVSVGLNFGELKYTRIQSVQDVQFGTIDLRTSKVNGLDFTYALSYNPELKEKHRLFTSLRVNTQANLTSRNTQRVGSFSLVDGNEIEVIDVDLEVQGLHRTFLKIPTTTTFGVGYGKDQKWFLGAEMSLQGLSDFENEFLGVENLEYTNASTYAFGGYYLPNYSAFNGYFKRIVYRAGVRYDKTGMMLNGKDVNNFGITFGFGLPLGLNTSNLNVGFELGRRGTTAANLIEEDYFKVSIGLSMNDRWFVKRRIN